MRFRRRLVGTTAAAAAALVVASTLSACQSNVGVAAVIDGTHVSESQVTSYLTSDSKPVTIGQGDTAPPRVFVLDVLILRPFFRKEIAASSVGPITDRRLAAARSQQLNGKSESSVARSIGIRGYSASFDRLVVDLSILAEVRQQVGQASIAAIEAKIPFPVHLNPRYGTWSRKTLFIDSSASAGTPSFLNLQPTAAAGS